MSSHFQTLRNYLRTPDPTVNGDRCPKGGNTTQSTYDTPREILEWNEFEYDTLNSIYGGRLCDILNETFDLVDFTNIPDFPFCRYYDEDSFQGLLVKWNWSVVSEALSKSQPLLLQAHDHVYMVKGGQAPSPKAKAGEKRKERGWKPDWGCVAGDSGPTISPGDEESQPSLLPGDSKVSKKWSSSLIEPGRVQNRWGSKSWLSPLRQIYSYCLSNNRRYGYLITDLELVVVRVRISQPTTEQTGLLVDPDTDTLRECARKSGVLEYKAIPWQAATDDPAPTASGLTMNLALWWLHLMAAGNTNIGGDYGELRDAVWAPVSRKRSFTPPLRTDLTKVSIDISDIASARGNNWLTVGHESLN